MVRLINADSIPWDVDGVGTIPVVTKEEIDRMPTVDAEPVRHAYWIKKMTVKLCVGFDVYEPHWYCSNCKEKYEPSFAQICKYCYVCGAKMDTKRTERI